MNSSIPEIEKRIEEKDNKVENVKNYDLDNCYPQNIEDILNASGTASSCSNLYAEFIFGQGFKDQTFYKAQVNDDGLTIDELFKMVCHKFSRLNGYAIHVNYNALLKISDAKFVPFEYCRLGIGDYRGKIAVYSDWDCKVNKKVDKTKIEYIDIFNDDPEILKEQINGDITTYKGQIFWKSAKGKDYPLAPCDSVLEDVVADSDIKRFRLRNIRKGFNASTIVEYGYKFEDAEERQQEADNWGKFLGPDSADLILLENANGNGENKSVKISKLDVANNDKMYEVTNNTVKNSIIQCYRQPKRLLAMSEDAGFNSVDVKDDFLFYNSITSKERIMIEEDFKHVFKNFHININPTGDYSVVMLEFNPVTTEEPALISTLGIGGTQAMVEIVGNAALTPEQKVNFLRIVFGLTTEKAQGIVLGLPVAN